MEIRSGLERDDGKTKGKCLLWNDDYKLYFPERDKEEYSRLKLSLSRKGEFRGGVISTQEEYSQLK